MTTLDAEADRLMDAKLHHLYESLAWTDGEIEILQLQKDRLIAEIQEIHKSRAAEELEAALKN